MVLGVAQDGGYPQAGCAKDCCKGKAWGSGYPVSLVLTDFKEQKAFLFECSPSFPEQWKLYQSHNPGWKQKPPSGIILTHAHVGHYAGLIHFGREVMGTKDVPVYALPRMIKFLQGHGPWSQLVQLNQIKPVEISANKPLRIADQVSITPIPVPHRDEYSETAGFMIRAGNRKILFIPDIDKWEKWSDRIESWLEKCDLAFLDATFYANGELNRDMSEIPHPFVAESIARFEKLPEKEKNKIQFIHMNHTNPLLRDQALRKELHKLGYGIAKQGQIFQW